MDLHLNDLLWCQSKTHQRWSFPAVDFPETLGLNKCVSLSLYIYIIILPGDDIGLVKVWRGKKSYVIMQ